MALQKHCLKYENSKTPRCQEWYNDPDHSTGRIAIRDEMMRKYCQENPTTDECSCFNPKDFRPLKGMPNKPECYYKSCTQNGYMTQDMKNSSYSCPNITICTQNISTSDSDHLVLDGVNTTQSCTQEDVTQNVTTPATPVTSEVQKPEQQDKPITPSPDDKPPETTPHATPTFDPDHTDSPDAPPHSPADLPHYSGITGGKDNDDGTTLLITKDEQGNQLIAGLPTQMFIMVMIFITNRNI